MNKIKLNIKSAGLLFTVSFVLSLIIYDTIIPIDDAYADETTSDTQKVIEFTLEYKGEDKEGETLEEFVGILLDIVYPNSIENSVIMEHLTARPDYNIDPDGRYWKVQWSIHTYKVNLEMVWFVDTINDKIFAANELSKDLLNTLN